MPHIFETTRQEGGGVWQQVLFAPLIAIAGTTTTALIFGLAAMLSWQECLMVVLAAAAFAGGAVFTVLEIQRLGKRSQ